MKNIQRILWTSIALGICVPAMADIKLPKTKVSMENCMEAALAKRDGEVVKLEFKDEHGVPTYEFEILGKDGKSWELECDANKGKITEEEQEVENADAIPVQRKSQDQPGTSQGNRPESPSGRGGGSRVRNRVQRRCLL